MDPDKINIYTAENLKIIINELETVNKSVEKKIKTLELNAKFLDNLMIDTNEQIYTIIKNVTFF